MKAKRAVIATLLCMLSTSLATPSATAGSQDGAVVTHWNAIAQRTIYTEAATPVPIGQLYFGFVSAAVYDAVRDAEHGKRKASVTAAVATAAHDVLAEYFPNSATALATDLAGTLASVPDGPREDRGVRIGAAAAAALIADRVDDGRNAPIMFTVPPAPGVWRPTPPANAPFLAPWLGFVRPMLIDSPAQIHLDGPDALTSRQYTKDFAEVKSLGSATSSTRSAKQTETALFFSANPVIQYQTGMRDLADRKDFTARKAAQMFAAINMTAVDALITCWRAKLDHPFWRPITGIREADTDGNPRTTADPAWTSLIAAPPYSDYTSGHACNTGAVATGLATLAGSDRIDLYVSSVVNGVTLTRHYTSARKLIRDAFNARIWLGIHFRTAMEDGSYIGKTASRLGFAELGWR